MQYYHKHKVPSKSLNVVYIVYHWVGTMQDYLSTGQRNSHNSILSSHHCCGDGGGETNEGSAAFMDL